MFSIFYDGTAAAAAAGGGGGGCGGGVRLYVPPLNPPLHILHDKKIVFDISFLLVGCPTKDFSEFALTELHTPV